MIGLILEKLISKYILKDKKIQYIIIDLTKKDFKKDKIHTLTSMVNSEKFYQY